MELVLKSNNEKSIAKIIALAKKLNVSVEERAIKATKDTEEVIKNRIINFKAESPSSFGDIEQWQIQQREDRNLPFS